MTRTIFIHCGTDTSSRTKPVSVNTRVVVPGAWGLERRAGRFEQRIGDNEMYTDSESVGFDSVFPPEDAGAAFKFDTVPCTEGGDGDGGGVTTDDMDRIEIITQTAIQLFIRGEAPLEAWIRAVEFWNARPERL